MTELGTGLGQLELTEAPTFVMPGPVTVVEAPAGPLPAEPTVMQNRPSRKPTMTRDFLLRTRGAVNALRRAQEQRARLEGVARERHTRAQAEYRAALERAGAIEGRAWQALLEIPGVTAKTAAVLAGVSVSTVNRRVKEARHG